MSLDSTSLSTQAPASTYTSSEGNSEVTGEDGNQAMQRAVDAAYFDGYSAVGIHETMMKDPVRMAAYEKAIVQNSHLFQGKTVLDCGCGAGILSLFAAKAGASHVYAVDNASIIDVAKQVAKQNGHGEKITFIKGKLEEVTLPVDKVDIIISEWMGYCLLYECMLQSVIFARNKWLKRTGLMFPDVATMHIAAIEDHAYRSQKINWWNSVHGFDFSAAIPHALSIPIVDSVPSHLIVSNVSTLKEFDLYTIESSDLEFEAPFDLVMGQKDFVHAFVVHFRVEFSCCHTATVLSTSPTDDDTHWKQTIFYLTQKLVANRGDRIEGIFSLRQHPTKPRTIDFTIESSHVQWNHKDFRQICDFHMD